MEKAKGDPLYKTWFDLDNEQHIRIAKRVANWQNELSNITANLMGGLYLRWTPTHLEFFIGRFSYSAFDENRRLCYDFDRGPYESVHAFYNAMLDMILKECQDPVLQALRITYKLDQGEIKADCSTEAAQKLISSEIHQDDVENWRGAGPHWSVWHNRDPDTRAVQALKDSLPVLCPPTIDDDLQTVLQHDDLSLMNILVDAAGNPTALIDWEQIAFKPLRLYPEYPIILRGARGHDVFEDPQDPAWVFDDPPSRLDWKNLSKTIEDVVATHLRELYRKELERLASPLLALFEPEHKFESALREKVFFPFKHPDLLRWIEWVQEPDEDEDTEIEQECQDVDEGGVEQLENGKEDIL